MTRATLVWSGSGGDFRTEVAHVETDGRRLRARGTQIGLDEGGYELRYELEEPHLRVEIVGGGSAELELDDGRDHFDLGYSPLFNSLPVLAHDLHRGGEALDFTMTWVSVPDLGVDESRQRYAPLDAGTVRFTSGDFTADLVYDADGFVVHYPGLADRVRSG